MTRINWSIAMAVFCLCFSSAVPGKTADNVFPGKWFSSTLGQLAPLLEPREGACVDTGPLSNRIYMTHGFSGGDTRDVRAYDIDTDTWFDPAPTVDPAVPIKSEGAGATVGRFVYCVGGRIAVATNNVTVYDPITNTLANVASMITPRAGVAVASWGKHIYAVGGRLAGGGPCSDVVPIPTAERFDVTTNTWALIAPPPVAVMDASAVSHGGKIYVVGGCTVAGGILGPTNVLQMYNPATNTWTLLPSMPTPRASLATGILPVGNTLYAIGGITGFLGANLTTVEAFDIDKGAWDTTTAFTPKPTPSSEVQAAARGQRLYLPGSGAFGASQNTFEAFEKK